MSRWPVWASAPERASDTTGCSRLARGPRLPARPCLQVPLDCGQGGRAGSWCLGPRNVCTRPGIVGFPVRCGPPGRSEERNGRQGGSACRWPQVFHSQAIRSRPMTLFNPVFNCLTPKGIKRSKTQAAKKMRNAECGIGSQFNSYFFRIPNSEFPIPHSGNRWLGPRTPSLREGPGSASVPSGSPDPAAGTGARVLGNEPSQLSPESASY